jgi:diguanylate cyclase (GGDEF)-like protein/PAS domain S-box-containing protein
VTSALPSGSDQQASPATSADHDAHGFRLLVERSDHMIGRHHPNGRFFYVSPGCEGVLGFRPDELMGTDPYALAHPDDLAAAADIHKAVSLSNEPLRVSARLRRRDGSYLWCHITMRGVRDTRTGALLEIHSSSRDATDWREVEALRQREEMARSTLTEHEALLRVAKAVAREDPPERIFSLVTEEAARLLSADASRIAHFHDGHAVVRGTWGRDTPPVGRRFPLSGNRPVVQVYRSGAPARSDSYAQLRAVDPASASIVPASYQSGVAAPIFVDTRLWGVIVTSRIAPAEAFPEGAEMRLAGFADLVALAIASSNARAELAIRATTDSLTGLVNHRTFHERLDGEIGRVRRHHHPLSLAVFDLDNFKEVNDRHGHLAGDAVLVEVARRLNALARAGDVVGRMGGEEFAWILPETDIHSATAAARRACRAIRDVPFAQVGTVTASVGVCGVGSDDDARSIYRLADEALYRAKALGRDRVVPAHDLGHTGEGSSESKVS